MPKLRQSVGRLVCDTSNDQVSKTRVICRDGESVELSENEVYDA